LPDPDPPPAVAAVHMKWVPWKSSVKPLPFSWPAPSWVNVYSGWPLSVSCWAPSGRFTTPNLRLRSLVASFDCFAEASSGFQKDVQPSVQRIIPPFSTLAL
jgi:hypothetical protein